MLPRGVARIFQRGGGGGHTVSNIVMAFSPRNIVGCFLEKGLQRGGHGHPRTPFATPLLSDYCTCAIVIKLSTVASLNASTASKTMSGGT